MGFPCGLMRPEVEVPCPRATLAATIAAALFEPKRSGQLTNRTVGSSLAGRISEAWPILAPPGDCALNSDCVLNSPIVFLTLGNNC